MSEEEGGIGVRVHEGSVVVFIQDGTGELSIFLTPEDARIFAQRMTVTSLKAEGVWNA